MAQSKGFASIALVLIALLILGGGYWVWKSKVTTPTATVPTSVTDTNIEPPTPSNITSPTNPDTADWKTYRNEKFGFEIKYPSDWISKDGTSELVGFFYVDFGVANSLDSNSLVTLKIYPNQSTLDKFIKYFYFPKAGWQNSTLGGITAKETISVSQDTKPSIILIATVKNSYGYELSSTVFGESINTTRKMSSTFRFIK